MKLDCSGLYEILRTANSARIKVAHNDILLTREREKWRQRIEQFVVGKLITVEFAVSAMSERFVRLNLCSGVWDRVEWARRFHNQCIFWAVGSDITLPDAENLRKGDVFLFEFKILSVSKIWASDNDLWVSKIEVEELGLFSRPGHVGDSSLHYPL